MKNTPRPKTRQLGWKCVQRRRRASMCLKLTSTTEISMYSKQYYVYITYLTVTTRSIELIKKCVVSHKTNNCYFTLLPAIQTCKKMALWTVRNFKTINTILITNPNKCTSIFLYYIHRAPTCFSLYWLYVYNTEILK